MKKETSQEVKEKVLLNKKKNKMNDKYIEISKLISLLDPEEDAILIHRKIKTIVELFQHLITDDDALQ